jgi:amino acid transporter
MSSKLDIADEPGMTFREKSLWVSLVATLVIYAHYFVRVLQLGDGDAGRIAGLFIGTVIAMIVVSVVANAALAIHRTPERSDERDRSYALTATRISYYVLMTGVWAALTVGALQLGAFWVIQAGLAAIVLGEIVRCGVQVYLYRRG